MSITSLGIAVSGLSAAQAGLYVTGHNMANVDTIGYSRQRVMQSDFLYSNIGMSPNGVLQRGLGTNITGITQLRNNFVDMTYRTEVCKENFYNVKVQTGSQIEDIIGELGSEYTTQGVIQDLWNSINELSVYQPGLETRGTFVSTAITFLDKVNNIYDRLVTAQHTMDQDVRETVTRINQLVTGIEKYNRLIVSAEASGDHANDFRDARNNDLDELSKLISIDYKEQPDGRVNILTEGKELLVNGVANHLGLKYTTQGNSFAEPVFTNARDILTYDADPSTYTKLYQLTGKVDSQTGNDQGKLKALLLCRGTQPANYTSYPGGYRPAPKLDSILTNPTDAGWANPAYQSVWDAYRDEYNTYLAGYQAYLADTSGPVPVIPAPPDPSAYGAPAQYQALYVDYLANTYGAYQKSLANYDSLKETWLTEDAFNATQAVIPKAMRELDNLVHNIVTMINEAAAPNSHTGGPYDLTGTQSYQEIFSRKNVSRYNGADVYNAEVAGDYYSLYTLGNLTINPIYLTADGYGKMSLSRSGDREDTDIIKDMLSQWKSKFISYDGSQPMSIDDAYSHFVTGIAAETAEAKSMYDAKVTLVTQAQNQRASFSGVSMDEEMANMLKYQHAYNAAARVVNQIDSMLDRIINNTGRAGR